MFCVSLDRYRFNLFLRLVLKGFDNLFPNGNVVESTDLCFIRDDWKLSSKKQHLQSGTIQHYWFSKVAQSYKTIHAPKDGQRIGPRHPLTFEPSDPAKTQYVPSDRVIAGHSPVKLSTG